jgi:hypothetical protein
MPFHSTSPYYLCIQLTKMQIYTKSSYLFCNGPHSSSPQQLTGNFITRIPKRRNDIRNSTTSMQLRHSEIKSLQGLYYVGEQHRQGDGGNKLIISRDAQGSVHVSGQRIESQGLINQRESHFKSLKTPKRIRISYKPIHCNHRPIKHIPSSL